jgi:hypothetical protein
MTLRPPSGRTIRVANFLLLGIGLLALLSVGCRQGVPVIDPSPGVAQAFGTISGTVRASQSAAPIEGRLVEVVNVDTGERQRATTSNVGGFTFKVAPGKYRVQVALQDGETVVKGPGIMNVNRSDVDAHADFILGTVKLVRPRYPVPPNPLLGSPVA